MSKIYNTRPKLITPGSFFFEPNKDYNLENIENSLLVPANVTFATLIGYNGIVTLETRGSIYIEYVSPNEPYSVKEFTDPSEYPEELKEIFKTNDVDKFVKYVNVINSNWFEIFYQPFDADGNLTPSISSFDIDAEGLNERDIFEEMRKYYIEQQSENETENNRKEVFYCNCCGEEFTSNNDTVICPNCGCEYDEDNNFIEKYYTKN